MVVAMARRAAAPDAEASKAVYATACAALCRNLPAWQRPPS